MERLIFTEKKPINKKAKKSPVKTGQNMNNISKCYLIATNSIGQTPQGGGKPRSERGAA